jgi:chromosome partitioning protein
MVERPRGRRASFRSGQPGSRRDARRSEGQGAKLAIIDTPPAVSDSLAATLAVADLVVVPVRASPNDLRAVAATVELIEQVGKPMLFVINAVKPRVRLTGEAAIALSQHGTVAPTMIWDRADYAGAMTDGRTAPELDPKGRAAEETATLWTYISDRLARTS